MAIRLHFPILLFLFLKLSNISRFQMTLQLHEAIWNTTEHVKFPTVHGYVTVFLSLAYLMTLPWTKLNQTEPITIWKETVFFLSNHGPVIPQILTHYYTLQWTESSKGRTNNLKTGVGLLFLLYYKYFLIIGSTSNPHNVVRIASLCCRLERFLSSDSLNYSFGSYCISWLQHIIPKLKQLEVRFLHSPFLCIELRTRK